MKQLVIFFSLMVLLVSFASAQTPQSTPAPPAGQETKTIAETLNWMIGTWEGTGKARGTTEFRGKLTVTEELDGSSLLLNRESMTATGDPSGGLKELMIVGFDGTTKKIVGTLYSNKNEIAIFVGEVQNNQIVFNLAATQAGYVNKRTFQAQPDGGLSFTIEAATPGKEPTKQVEITFKKK